jgi:hypothetical protein
MTDFTDANVKFWRHHPQLKSYFDRGMMDSAIFNAVTDSSMTLTESGVTLGVGSVKNPLCIVANYLFDTLCHDIFQVTPSPPPSDPSEDGAGGGGGVLKEGLISVGSRRAEEPDPLDPEIIKRLDNRFRYDPVGDDYYSDKEDGNDARHFERMFRWYREYFGQGSDRSGASLLIPIGALRALRRLTAFSNGRCLVVSGDKGNNNPEQVGPQLCHSEEKPSTFFFVAFSFSFLFFSFLFVFFHWLIGLISVPRPDGPPHRGARLIQRDGELPRHRRLFHLPRGLRAAQPAGGGQPQSLRLRAAGPPPRRGRCGRRRRGQRSSGGGP